MATFIVNLWIMLGALALMAILKFLLPKLSYTLRTSLIISFFLVIIFLYQIVILIRDDATFWSVFWPVFHLGVTTLFIYRGGVGLAYKTSTIVFSKVNGEPVGVIGAGSMNWRDPFLEEVGKTLSLKEILIEIPETPELQTASRGIKAKIKEISATLQLIGDIRSVFKIEGDFKTIKKRIQSFIDEFFIHEVGALTPENLDKDKKDTIHTMVKKLKRETNEFCRHRNYPYRLTDVLIGDTELEKVYYEALADIILTTLREEAKMVSAEGHKARILMLGGAIMPNGTEAEKVTAAQVTLDIVKRDIQEKKFSLDDDLRKLVKEVVEILKRR
ncbi:MAG: hypothetical protein V4665_00860 [Patescibacteria group bacterium]